MGITNKRKYEVSDPAYYDPLIANQRRRVRQHPHDAKEWMELGRLHEAKIDMTNYFAKVVDQANYPEVTSLTLGQYHFALKLTLENDYALKEYKDFLDWVCATSGAVFGGTFLNKLETVVKMAEPDKTTAQTSNVHIGFKGYVDGSIEFYGDRIELLTGYSREEFNSKKIKWTDLILEEDTGNSRDISI